jgi:hypothetical protein
MACSNQRMVKYSPRVSPKRFVSVSPGHPLRFSYKIYTFPLIKDQQSLHKRDIGHRSKAFCICPNAMDIFKESDNNVAVELANEVLHRSPDLIQPEMLLEAAKGLICRRISELINAQPVSPLINDIIKSSLELLGTAVKLVPSNLLLETISLAHF